MQILEHYIEIIISNWIQHNYSYHPWYLRTKYNYIGRVSNYS